MATAIPLPEADVYERGLEFWPYKASLDLVIKNIVEQAPSNSHLVDMMCGPGYLLGRVKKLRPDLTLVGVDIDRRYIEYGRQAHPSVYFKQGNVLSWSTTRRFETVVCTGAIHHVPYEQQEVAIATLASLVVPRGMAIISDCYIDDYSTENERKLAAARLGYEYLKVTIDNAAPDDVVGWTIDILRNDVFKGEFKTSFLKREPLLEKHFRNVDTYITWPVPGSNRLYGDYVHLCRCK